MADQKVNRVIKETDDTVKVWDTGGKRAREWEGDYAAVRETILSNLETYSELFYRTETGGKVKKSREEW